MDVDALRANVDAFPHMPSWRSALARIFAETDRVDEAREQVAILGRNGFEDTLAKHVADKH